MTPHNLQCFRLLILTIVQKQKHKISDDLKKQKNIEKRNFKILKYFSSEEFHLKIYLLLTIFHLLFFLLTVFIFQDIFLVNRGCAVQYINAGTKNNVKFFN
jgi:hypothetical protein